MKKRQKIPKKKVEEEELKLIKQIAESACAQQQPPDKADLFGQYVSASLKEFDELTRNIAQHRISNIIFEAQVGLLTRQQPAVTHNTTPFYPTMSDNSFSAISQNFTTLSQ